MVVVGVKQGRKNRRRVSMAMMMMMERKWKCGMCFLKVRKNVEYWGLGLGFWNCVEVRKVKGEHVLAWYYGLCACEAIYNNMTLR